MTYSKEGSSDTLTQWPPNSISRNVIHSGCPLSEVLGMRSALNFMFSQTLEYLHAFNQVSKRWDSTLNTKFMYVSYTPYTNSLIVSLHWVYRVNSCGFFYL